LALSKSANRLFSFNNPFGACPTCHGFGNIITTIAKEIKPGVILDYDANDNVVGIEILGLSTRVPVEMLKSLQFETV
jgi:excinuclease UvrABC ATPase subunit